jgi:pyruvate, orthophosphate dikinase
VSYLFALDHRHEAAASDVERLVGGKAANLGIMARDLGLPVPPGFVITTEACREYLAGRWPSGLDTELYEGMRGIERTLGRRFGDPANPLLVSVRSGAPVSMPGMMDTILDLGLNEATTAGLAAATGDDAFAHDCLARFRSMFRATVGVDDVPDDPWVQLRQAVEAVFRSWNSPRAAAYRRREHIPDDLGTAVTVQAMVFGNLDGDSASGVVFTRNPAAGDPVLYGDVLFHAQGEDVVAGTHETLPIAALDDRLPVVARSLREHATRLERHYRDVCDIEFTIERGRLWMLQTRVAKRSPQAAVRIAHDMAEDADFPLSWREAVERVANVLADPPRTTLRDRSARPLTTGIAASPGIATGEIATTAEAAERAADSGRPVILVRPETSPDDVHGMARSAGVLTATGGLASHAAVVARGWGIPAVVGASEVRVAKGKVRIGERTYRAGDTITIDGGSGDVFEGAIAATSETIPEVSALLQWASELGITIGDGERAAPAVAARGGGSATPEACLRRLSTKGFATAANLADALRCSAEIVEPILKMLVNDGLALSSAGAYRLTDEGKRRAAELLALDRDAWSAQAASTALERFTILDGRLKEAVTAWQLRPTGGEPVVNDHRDAAYDTEVLERIAEVHAEASALLASVENQCQRLDGYRVRLTTALEHAQAGDQRYVASPRVDSYHGIWFELHEDLIQLAGRTRAEEVAAGRA